MSTSALASAAPGALPPAPQGPAPDVSYGRVIRVAAPMTLSTVTGIVSQLAATGMIARIGGSALYVRSVYTPVAFLLIAVTTGLGVTLQVAVAQCRGRGDDGQIRRYFGGVARVGAVAYLVLGGVLIASVRLLDGAVAIAPDRQAAFRAFLIAMTGATLLGMLGELCSATLRGIGRTGIGALVTVSYVTCYLGFIAVVGLVLHGGLMAVALAVALSGIIEISIGLAVLVRSGVLDLRAWTSWRPDVPRLLAAIGLPVAASFLVLFAVSLVLLHIVAPAGQHAVAGFSVGYTIQSAVIVPAVGFGSAVAVLMNQVVAGGSVQAARIVFRRGMLLAAGGYAAITVAVLTLGGPAATLLAGSPPIAASAREFVLTVGPVFGCAGLVVVAVTAMEQTGHATAAALMNASYFGTVLAIGWVVMDSTGDLRDVYRTLMISTIIGTIIGLPVSRYFARRPRALRREPAQPPGAGA